jgi:hypothetical protein
MASYKSDAKLREDDIYDWFLNNPRQTRHPDDPIGFASKLLDAAKAYALFVKGCGPSGVLDDGIVNTSYLGGKATRQHFILLLAARHLNPKLFSMLSGEVENLMYVYLATNTPAKDYERVIVERAKDLRKISNEKAFKSFKIKFFEAEKQRLSGAFDAAMISMTKSHMQGYRLRYVLAKLTQNIDIEAYGREGGLGSLASYIDGNNDVEHILPETPSNEALKEFGETSVLPEVPQVLGNLAFVEHSVNRSLGNKPYSEKSKVYPHSKFLLMRCQAAKPKIGTSDRITKAIRTIPTYPTWNRANIKERQAFLAGLARKVWELS